MASSNDKTESNSPSNSSANTSNDEVDAQTTTRSESPHVEGNDNSHAAETAITGTSRGGTDVNVGSSEHIITMRLNVHSVSLLLLLLMTVLVSGSV